MQLTCKLFGFSSFFTHLLDWPCGSIIRGQRWAFVTMIALSMEKLQTKNRTSLNYSSRLCWYQTQPVNWKACNMPRLNLNCITQCSTEREAARARDVSLSAELQPAINCILSEHSVVVSTIIATKQKAKLHLVTIQRKLTNNSHLHQQKRTLPAYGTKKGIKKQ